MNQSADFTDEPNEREISLKPLFLTIWAYRRVIAASVSATLIIFVLVTLGLYLLQPAERRATLPFRLVFDGANKNQYPNGLPFGTADIISPPVLGAVYDANDLKRYGSYEDFKNRIFILESNRDLQLLEFEYTA